MMTNIPVSREMFNEMFENLAEKIYHTPDTIFENINLLDVKDTAYNAFINNKLYYDDFIAENSRYKKNKIIKEFIENEFLSEPITAAS